MAAAAATPIEWLDPEKVAYWYFRLNGFLQIENFVVHPTRQGSQRTDADLLAIRFPDRKEFLYDDPQRIMRDDVNPWRQPAETSWHAAALMQRGRMPRDD